MLLVYVIHRRYSRPLRHWPWSISTAPCSDVGILLDCCISRSTLWRSHMMNGVLQSLTVDFWIWPFLFCFIILCFYLPILTRGCVRDRWEVVTREISIQDRRALPTSWRHTKMFTWTPLKHWTMPRVHASWCRVTKPNDRGCRSFVAGDHEKLNNNVDRNRRSAARRVTCLPSECVLSLSKPWRFVTVAPRHEESTVPSRNDWRHFNYRGGIGCGGRIGSIKLTSRR